ncbi:ParB N-terminal domain-containing protein [Kibdelosporangium lantanae]|uniref:ParB N-terminal domain-containing protein n=1 Tax=Kibdelosporangium lantanae TaxID=1497396 RepID=A0ABW3M263_9PSEU
MSSTGRRVRYPSSKNNGNVYVVDGHHRLAAARLAGVESVRVEDVTEQLIESGFQSYRNMKEVLDSAATYLGNRLKPYKLR